MSDVTVITYDHPHRKTYDVLCALLADGYRPDVIAIPWQTRKRRKMLYAHRPSEPGCPCISDRGIDRLCGNLDLKLDKVDTLQGKLDTDVVVIAGAGILPKEFVTQNKVINVHPGLLPARRGLDVLKWSVIDCAPVGVTAHLVDEHTDLGWRIKEEIVPVLANDTFHSFALRQYEQEINMIPDAVDSVRYKNLKGGPDFERIYSGESVAFRRMPVKIESGLIEAFERYKRAYAVTPA